MGALHEAGGGKALAANARYAATFYPVHRRSDSGVSTSVGTELGFYEGAAAARGDREKDRKAMFGQSGEEEDALERAAASGVGDAQAFSFGDDGDGWMLRKGKIGGEDDAKDEISGGTVAVEADPDAFTVGANEEVDAVAVEPAAEADLPSIYEQIKANKAKASESIQMGEDTTEERPDPGYRIYHVDSATREVTEVPPYTSPGEFFQMKAEGKLESKLAEGGPNGSTGSATAAISSDAAANRNEGGEQPSFDGYSTIREAYGEGTTAEQTAEATRQARMRNRIKTSEIDESKIGVMFMADSAPSKAAEAPLETSPDADVATPSLALEAGDLSSVYDKIKSNKALANENIEMGDATEEEKPDLDFTIYHVDSKTREVREVPQYTSPGEFFDDIEKEKAANGATAVNGAKTPKASVPNVQMDDESSVTPGGEVDDSGMANSDEKTLDGYQAIMSANSAPSREEELLRMKEARMANRARPSEIMGGSPNL